MGETDDRIARWRLWFHGQTFGDQGLRLKLTEADTLLTTQAADLEALRQALDVQQRKEQAENRWLELRERAEKAEAELEALRGDAAWRARWHDRLGRGAVEPEGRFYERLEALRRERDALQRGCNEWNANFETWRAQCAARAEAAEAQVEALRRELVEWQAVARQQRADKDSERDRRVAAQEAIVMRWEPKLQAAEAENAEWRSGIRSLVTTGPPSSVSMPSALYITAPDRSGKG